MHEVSSSQNEVLCNKVWEEHFQVINQSTHEEAGINKAFPHLLSQDKCLSIPPPPHHLTLGLVYPNIGEYSGFGQNSKLGALPWTA